jgi:hypothetical protein
MESEFAFRSVGDDVVCAAESLPEFEPGPVEFRDDSESAAQAPRAPRRRRDPVEVQAPTESPSEAQQRPFLLGLVDRFVELLSALWDRLNSL